MRTIDVAVVGAGPSGISAALAAASAGAAVALLDENALPGGTLRWTTAVPIGLEVRGTGAPGRQYSEWAQQELARAGVQFVCNAAVWGLFDHDLLGVVEGEQSYQLRCGRLIVATGSTDITVPFPGWDLPGVMTARATLRAMNEWAVLPGLRFAVIGEGAAALDVIQAVHLAGATTVKQASDCRGFRAGGSRRVEWAELDDHRVDADTVVIALGRQPDPELALQALCAVGYSALDRAHVPLRSETLETSISGVYVAGDAGGICTAQEAIAEGRLAGLAATGSSGIDEALQALASLRTADRAAGVRALHLPSQVAS